MHLPPHNVYVHEEDANHTCKVSVRFQRGFHTLPIAPFDPLVNEWCCEEDSLLIGCEARGGDTLKAYTTASEEKPDVFGKVDITQTAINERLHTLKAEHPHRYQLLKNAALYNDEGTRALLAYKRMRKKQDTHLEDVRIVCDGGEVMGCSKALAESSLKIKAYFGTLQSGEEKVLQLNREFSPLPGVDHYGAFSPEVVKCYVKIATRNDWLAERNDLADALQKALDARDRDWNAIFSELQRKLDTSTETLAQQREQEMDHLIRVLGEQLEGDIKKLRTLYASHIEGEKELIAARYTKEIDRIRVHYESEMQALKNLLTSPEGQSEAIDVLTTQLKIADSAVVGLYRVDMLPQLLILAEVIDALGVRETTIDMIAQSEKVVNYFTSREQGLGCQLLRSRTIREILTKVGTEQLVAILKDGNLVVPRDLVKEEYKVRLATAEEGFRNMTMEELAAVGAGDVFGGVAAAEMERRCDEREVSVVLKAVGGMVVGPDRRSVWVQQCGRYGVAVGSHGRCDGMSWGSVYWEGTIDTWEQMGGVTCGLGWEAVTNSACTLDTRVVAEPTTTMFKGIPGLAPGGNGLYGALLISSGLIYHNASTEETLAPFSKGDCIGVLLNLTTGTTTFTVNGHHVPRATAVPIHDHGHYHVVPAILLYAAGEKDKVKVTVNFDGPFKHLPREKGVAAYARLTCCRE